VRIKRLLLIIFVFCAAVSGVFIFQMFDVYMYSKNSSLKKVDAAIVLGAAAWGNNPSPVFRERINHAIDLYNRGYCDFIIITGGKGFPDEPGEGVIGRKYALKNGIPENAILIENYSRNTEENLHYALLIAGKHDLKTFVLVSDPYHMRRAMLIAEHNEIDAYPSATPTSRYRSSEEQLSFLAREAYYTALYRIENYFKLNKR
jgi:uncharacterized SAM-binding protein YcdF (DUF218 family)